MMTKPQYDAANRIKTIVSEDAVSSKKIVKK